MRTHAYIPDLQVKPNIPTEHLTWIGQYLEEKRPDVIINAGDFADMPSLSLWDKGKLIAEGRRVNEDIESTKAAMDLLLKPIKDRNVRDSINRKKQYKPEMYFTLGNHEHRINRAVDSDPTLSGFLSVDALGYEEAGWKVFEFLDVATVDGVSYSHYFYNPKTGKPMGGENLLTRLKNIGFSFSMGHQQGLLTAIMPLNNGETRRGLVAGSAYLHDEDYIGHQGNGHWRGIIMKHEVRDGNYDLMEVSLNYLCRRYEGVTIWEFMEKWHPDIFARSTWLNKLKEFSK